MFRLLKMTISGYRGLADGFSISFLTQAKVFDEDLSKQVVEIDKRLYGFRTMAVVGANSSGKSTLLRAVIMALGLLESGRFPYGYFDFAAPSISLSLDFYLDGTVYFYDCVLEPPVKGNGPLAVNNIPFAQIREEHLRKISYSAYRGNHVLDLKETAQDITKEILSRSLRDTSAISGLFRKPIAYDIFTNNAVVDFYDAYVRMTLYDYLKETDPKILAPVIELLDDSIEKIVPQKADRVLLKKKGRSALEVRVSALGTLLSSGTLRGIELFLRAYAALKSGSIFLVDEIEGSFHKDIVENLIFLFNDRETNPKGAMLLFSTHLSETLDLLKRTDSIYVMHRKKDLVYASNLKADYQVRSGLLTSHQLDSGIFDTGVNYEHVMNLRRAILTGTDTDIS